MGFFNDLVGAFTGSTARKDIAKGKTAALGDLDTGKGEALGYYDEAAGGLTPYTEGGQEGYNRYLDTLGLHGDDARAAAQKTYFDDPIQNQLMDRIQRGNNRSFGAVGMGNSGKATQSLTNALLQSYATYQDRLKGVGEGGMGAATATAGVKTGQGDIAFGTGQQKAGVEIGAANANAASRAAPINNLLSLIGTAQKAYTAYKTPAR